MRLTFGRFVFDPRLRCITRDGVKVELSPKAFALLEVLVEHRPAPVASKQLYDRLWPDTYVEIGNLHNLIAELRRALGDDDHTIIRTSRNVGYAFDPRDVGVASTFSPFVVCVGDEIVTLRTGENIIGRDPGATVIVESADVSRQHARLFVTDDKVLIEDLGSRNGTFVDNERVTQQRPVADGDVIRLGKTELLLRRKGSVKSTVPL